MTTQLDASVKLPLPELHYIQYDPDKEAQYLTAIRELISKDLSEPYSIYVYRYFLYQWADLCYMVSTLILVLFEIIRRDRQADFLLETVDSTGELIGVVVCKLEPHRDGPMRGYIAMLAVKKEHRGRGIASKLVRMAMDGMIAKDADEVSAFCLRPQEPGTDSNRSLSKPRLTTYLLSNSTND